VRPGVRQGPSCCRWP